MFTLTEAVIQKREICSALLALCGMDQAEFEQQLAVGEKDQMMKKLDMLLTTRGEPLEVIELVRVQTGLEVEVEFSSQRTYVCCRLHTRVLQTRTQILDRYYFCVGYAPPPTVDSGSNSRIAS